MNDQDSSAAAARQSRIAPPPFDKPDTDIILRSSDHVDFHVRRHILFEASPVFESILSIPPGHDEDPCPVVDLTEDHQTLQALLLSCYPVSRTKRQPMKSLAQLEAALYAAKKYDMELPLEELTSDLDRCVTGQPLQVWALACRLDLEDVASRAASLMGDTMPSFSILGRMEGVSAGNYYRLREYRRRSDVRTIAASFLRPPQVRRLADEQHGTLTVDNSAFSSKLPYPDLECRSADGEVFLVHKCLLSAASPILFTKIHDILSQISSSRDTRTTVPLPSLQLDERAFVLRDLLSMCYPHEQPLLLSASHCVAVILAAKKYEATSIINKAMQHWEIVAEAAPLESFLVSSRVELHDCARLAARYTLLSPLDAVYHPEREYSPALFYHNLLVNHKRCLKLLKAAILQELPETVSPPNLASDRSTSQEQAEDPESVARRRRAERFGIYESGEPVLVRPRKRARPVQETPSPRYR